MSLAGSRVSSIASSPLTLSSVSVSTFGAFSPTSGILSAAFVLTSTCVGAPTSVPLLRVATSTACRPAFSNSTFAA